MSKQQVKKVSTPQSDYVLIGPKESIFCVTTIIIQYCLNPPGHGIHQGCSGYYWDALPLLHDDITELVDVRHLILLRFPL